MNKIRRIVMSVPDNKLMFVPVPDSYQNFTIVDYTRAGTWVMETDSKGLNHWKINIPRGEYEIVGFSHKITEDQCLGIGITFKDYMKILSNNDITIDYSKFSGQWLVLKPQPAK